MSCGLSGQSSVPILRASATQEAEGIEISQFDLKNAVASEIFCKNQFTSKAPSFGFHLGFAIDYTTRGGISMNRVRKQKRSGSERPCDRNCSLVLPSAKRVASYKNSRRSISWSK